jgi:phage gpG-like protein
MEINSTAQDMLRRIQTFNAEVPQDIARTMDRENQETIGQIQQTRMTGKGPFPPAQGRLGVRTNRLRSSVRASKARVFGGEIASSIGSNVEYAAIHEFGGTIQQGARTNLFRQTFRRVKGGGVRFAKLGAKRSFSTTKRTEFKARTIVIPQRAPITRGIEDRRWAYNASISQAIIARGKSLGL